METSKFARIQARLIAEEKLPVGYAAVLTSQALTRFDPRVAKAVDLWAENALPADYAVAEMKVADIRRNYGCSEFLALCILNTALTDPDCFVDAVFMLGRVLADVEQ